MLVEGKLNTAKLTGYYESDFLSAAVTSNNNQSNSYTLRLRQAWAQAALNSGWSFTGGQMWSLVTETKKGVENRSEALPMTIDPQYTVGFSWARQYGFRVAKNLGNKAWLAFSVEDSQETIGGHGSTTNFLLGQQGASGGLYNPTANYSYNPSPDFIGKLAFEPGWGHFEVFGIWSPTSATGSIRWAQRPSLRLTGAFNNSVSRWRYWRQHARDHRQAFRRWTAFPGRKWHRTLRHGWAFGCGCPSRRRAGSGEELSSAGYSGMARSNGWTSMPTLAANMKAGLRSSVLPERAWATDRRCSTTQDAALRRLQPPPRSPLPHLPLPPIPRAAPPVFRFREQWARL